MRQWLSQSTSGKYQIHDTEQQVDDEPLDRYKEAVDELPALT